MVFRGISTSSNSVSSSSSSSSSSLNNNNNNDNNYHNNKVGNFLERKNIREILNKLEINLNQTFELWCEDINQQVRIGSSDFRTDERDSCLLYAGDDKTSIQGPETIFELVDLGDQAFALKSISNGLFVQVIPPGSGDSFDPWKISLGGNIPGANEKFRISPDGYLYSGLMGGFISCTANMALSGNSYAGMKSKFVLQPVDIEIAREMKERVDISNAIIKVQTKNLQDNINQRLSNSLHPNSNNNNNNNNKDQEKEKTNEVVIEKEKIQLKICLGIPMTSKNTKMTQISESPVWSNLFDSFMDSIDWSSNHYHFGFYLGFDKADELYDTGDAWSDMRDFFKNRAISRLKDQLIEQSLIDKILSEQLLIKLSHFDHLEGAPSQIVSQLMLKAYADGYDYFYQVNDDTQIITPNWADNFINSLQSNPVASNVGVTGPFDRNNDKIFTHSFVHRTHFEIFGTLFPTSFKNWWSDDWISTVYGSTHTFRHENIQIQHNVGAQKLGGYTRYTVDQSAKLKLDKELMLGHVQIDKWLEKHSYPRLPLPVVCGYIPLSRYLVNAFEIKKTNN